jgi:ABC-type multidrug transport system permease subunit
MVIGMGWFAALVIPSVMAATSEARSAVGQWIHAIFKGLSYIDPIVYLPSFRNHVFHGNLVDSLGVSLIIVVILTVVYLALAVLQWRRVEA